MREPAAQEPRGTLTRRGVASLASAAALATLLLLTPAASQAATFNVTRTDDPVPDGCAVNDCSLREAVIDANAAGAGDQILLPAATYTLSLGAAGEDLAATGDLDFTGGDLEIRGTGATPASTVIDATGLGDRIIDLLSGSDSRILNLTLRGGSEVDGGAIRSDREITIRRVVFDQNAASNDGGAIHSSGAFARVTIEDSTFSGNNAGADGGAIRNEDASTFVIARSTFTGNVAADRGGAIYNRDDGAVTLNDSRLENNRAEGGSFGFDGGAIFTQSSSSFTIVRSVLTGNRADEEGGAIFAQNDSALSIIETTISDNMALGTGANDGGGGISANNDSAVLIERSTISGNRSEEDGGGVLRDNDGQLLVHNSTVSGNTAAGNGGGLLFTSNTFGFNAVESSTVTNNTASGLGGGVYQESTALNELGFLNTIIAANTASGTANDCATDGTGLFTSKGFNLDSTGTCGFGGGGDIPSGSAVLGPLQDNGGATQTQALLTGSQAINAGSIVSCPAIDQREVARPFPAGGRCDIGAFESTSVAPPPGPDTTSPTITLKGSKNQKVGKAIKVKVSCDEDCTAVGSGKVTVKSGKGSAAAKKTTIKLKEKSKSVAGGETETLKLNAKGKKKKKKLKKAVKRAGKGTAKITVTVEDAAGNESSAKRKVKLK